MNTRAIQMATLCCIGMLNLSAAADPLIGKWKLNTAKSRLTGQTEKVAVLGGNKYKFSYGAFTWTVSADGTDQPNPFGGTQALTIQNANTWKLVYKVKGAETETSVWTLSADGKTTTRAGTGKKPNGDSFQDRTVLKRIAGAKGFAGTWQKTDVKISAPDEVSIEPWEGDGVALYIPSEKLTFKIKFDGKDYPAEGPTVPAGMASSGKRINSHTVVVMDKLNGKTLDTTEWKVSPDGKTITLTEHDPGQTAPAIYVYDRI